MLVAKHLVPTPVVHCSEPIALSWTTKNNNFCTYLWTLVWLLILMRTKSFLYFRKIKMTFLDLDMKTTFQNGLGNQIFSQRIFIINKKLGR